MSSEGGENDKFVFSDEEERARITGSQTNPAFRVGDKVNLLKSDGSYDGGPYLVASVVSSQACTLGFEDGRAARNGAVIEMAKLEAA